MTWRCSSCLTTLTRIGQADSVMQECPRCDKWMGRDAKDTAT